MYIRAYIPLLLSAALLLTGCGNKKHAGDTARQVPPIEVAQVTVDSVVMHKSYPGVLAAANTVNVVGRVNGTLVTQQFTDGQRVSRGQVLFTIDPTLYNNAVSEAEAQLATSRSSYAYASSHYEAVKKARESDAVSEMELAQAKSDMEQAQASIKNAEAQLKTARTNLGYCTITAPLSGRISAATVDPGAYIAGGAQPVTLATIYDDTSMKAVFSIEDSQHLKMLADQRRDPGVDYSRIPLQFEQPLGREYTANLTYEAPDIDSSTGTIELKAAVDNPDGELRDGMYVTVTVPYGFMPRAILVRDASIGTDQLGRYVYAVNDSNRVVYTPVEVGELVADTMRVITKGLDEHSRYVTLALLKVRNGMEIQPIEK